MLGSLANIGLTDVVDIGVVALLLWALISWSRRVHAILAMVGLAFLGLIYFAAAQLELQLTAWIFRGFFAVLVILVVVVFQDDLRRLFEQIAVLGLRRRPPRPTAGASAAVYRALVRLARTRCGALVVLAGREPLERHLQGGIELDAAISEELLLSIFDAHSPGHDGAVIVRGDRASRFAVHLPLSEDRMQLGPGGTRHAAALGLAERTDALCLAVSEERGTISVGQAGALRPLDRPEDLLEVLTEYARVHGPAIPGLAQRPARLRRRLLEGGASIALALVSWLAFVPGSQPGESTQEVAVEVENLPAGYRLERVEPATVRVTLSGPRRELLLVQAAEMSVVVDADLVRLGRRTFALQPDMVHHAAALDVVSFQPTSVRLHLRQVVPPG